MWTYIQVQSWFMPDESFTNSEQDMCSFIASVTYIPTYITSVKINSTSIINTGVFILTKWGGKQFLVTNQMIIVIHHTTKKVDQLCSLTMLDYVYSSSHTTPQHLSLNLTSSQLIIWSPLDVDIVD